MMKLLFHYPISFQPRASFDAYLFEECIRNTREVCLLASVLYVLFGVLDIWPIPSALKEVWLIRALVVLMMMGFLKDHHGITIPENDSHLPPYRHFARSERKNVDRRVMICQPVLCRKAWKTLLLVSL